MDAPNKKYHPIDCGFYDRLEAFATEKVPVDIEYIDVDGSKRNTTDKIKDLYIREHVEYTMLESGTEIRLDNVVSANGFKNISFTPEASASI